MIKYSAGCVTYNIEEMRFPAGEVGVRLSCLDISLDDDIVIKASLRTSDDIMLLLLTNDALRRKYMFNGIHLNLAYVPYARQDRVCNDGEALSIYVMAQLINSCNFASVTIVDPHSDVTPALINNCRVRTQVDIFRNTLTSWKHTHIVAPDAGAYKKAQKFSEAVGSAGVIICNKTRNTLTGKITGLTCSEDVKGKHLVVLDDICDGGRTFIELAAVLEGAASKKLMVTHGLFTKGVEVVAKHYDHVYTTNSYHMQPLEEESKITWRII